MTEFYPEGAFSHPTTPGQSAANDPNNSRPEDYAFSGPGDIDRSADDDAGEGYWEPTSEGESGSTNSRSRMWNAQARDTENNPPMSARADSVSEDTPYGNHEYGKS